MNKNLHVLTLLAVLAFLGATAAQAGPKVTICHFPPGNPANWHTITISENAVQTHLNRHGDLIGIACEDATCQQICGDADVCTQDVMADADDCVCVPEPRPDKDCDDGNPCTADSCDSASDPECVNLPMPGWPCSDGGVVGTCDADAVCDLCADVVCDPPDQCQLEGECEGGVCNYPPADDGTVCDDDDDGTINDQCTSGICVGEPDLCAGLTCDPPQECEQEGICTDGLCEYLPATDGTPCTGGVCNQGTCDTGGDVCAGCINDCAGLLPGNYKSCDGCDEYIQCGGFFPGVVPCFGGQVFDGTGIGGCVDPPSTTCFIGPDDDCDHNPPPPPE